MGAEILLYASYICYAVAAVLLILAIVMFFKMKIKNVIYELSGKAKVASTQRMTDSYAVTGSLRTSTSLSDSLEKSGAISDSLSKASTGSLKSSSGNIRKAGQGGKAKSGNTFKITKDVMIVHTNERIL